MPPPEKLGKKLAVLIEINVGGETRKERGGAGFCRTGRIPRRPLPGFEHLEFRGLMTVPPFTEDPSRRAPIFAKLRELA